MGKYIIQQEKDSLENNKAKNIQKLSKPNQKNNAFYLKKIETQQQEAFIEFPIIRMGKNKSELAIPKFRNDKLFYTPSFTLPNQLMTKSNLRDQKQMFKLRAKMQALDDEDSFILFPYPNSSMGSCRVCHEKFQNYRQHIQSKTHIDKIKCSLYNFRINQLCMKYSIEKFFRGVEDLLQTKNQQSKEVQIPNSFLNISQKQGERKEKNLQHTKQTLYMQLKQELKVEGKNKEIHGQINPTGVYNIYDVLQF